MEKHMQIFLNRLSYASIAIAIAIATLTLLFLSLQSPDICLTSSSAAADNPHHLHRFPRSPCDSSPRPLTTFEKKNNRLWSSHSWQNKVSSYVTFFQDLGLLHYQSKVLCVSARAGHEAMALAQLGVADVTAVEVVDSPPLLRRADPHYLPFFDGVFDLAFSAHLEEALFPSRFVSEMERRVRPGGDCVVAVEECGDSDVGEIVGLFGKSRFVGAVNLTFGGSRMTRIVMRRTKRISS